MARVELRGVKKRFGTVEVIHGIDLEIAHGEFTVFVGPSGCGKSTLLRLICGLEPASEGEIVIGTRSMRGVSPSKRGVAMVFQSYALYPHMTVADNMAFSLRMASVPRRDRDAQVRRAAEILQLEELLDRRPKELSGGQRQRVAIGRAIVREPEVFLFDEPLSNLDAELRVQMRLELAKLHRTLGATMVFVTHDQTEAMTLADRIVVMREGYIEQIGSPLELYSAPRNRFVAGFIGSPKMNFLRARVAGRDGKALRINVPGMNPEELVLMADETPVQPGDEVTLGVRPEHLLAGAAGPPSLEARVEFVEQLGGVSYLHAPDHPAGALVVKQDGSPSGLSSDRALRIGLRPELCHLFTTDDQAIPVGRAPVAESADEWARLDEAGG
jgi:ABC-type sugar transport system ATPase subunit